MARQPDKRKDKANQSQPIPHGHTCPSPSAVPGSARVSEHRAKEPGALLLTALLIAACSVQLTVTTFCQPSPGEIDFGRSLDANGIALHDCAKSFKHDGDFAFVGVFQRQVTGEVVLEVVKDNGTPNRVGGYVFSVPGNYYSGQWHLSDFPGEGNYFVSMKFNDEILATGHFNLTE